MLKNILEKERTVVSNVWLQFVPSYFDKTQRLGTRFLFIDGLGSVLAFEEN